MTGQEVLQSNEVKEKVCLHAEVKRIVFYNKDNGYTIISAKNGIGDFTIVCYLPFEPEEGRDIDVEGEWISHPKYGRQLSGKVTVKEPSTEEGITEYLSSGVIKGIGPSMARRIVAAFGVETLKIIDEDPNKLLDVKGIGAKGLKKISESWKENREGAQIVAELTTSFNLSVAYATRIYKAYGSNAISMVRENPYRLSEDIWGVGFKKADDVAKTIGFSEEHPYRIAAGVSFTLNEGMSNGHCYMPQTLLITTAAHLLGVSDESVRKIIDEMQAKDKLTISANVGDEPGCYLTSVYGCETYINKKIRELITQPNTQEFKWQIDVIDGVELTPEQSDAARTALKEYISVITGSAGTGKTTTLKAIIKCLKDNELRYALCAPTGKAAKRISEVTGDEAKTIHRLLGCTGPNIYEFNEGNPLDLDYVIIDETSMVDLFLMYTLLKAIKPGTHIVMIGDPNQLPPVGAGNILKDVIKSGVCNVMKLSTIKRQKADSHIIKIANDINSGIYPHIPNADNVFAIKLDEASQIAEKIVNLTCDVVPDKFRINFEDIQVISPMKKGDIGTDNLNKLIQAKIHGKIQNNLKGFMLNDKVMQMKNNYNKDVFNGDIGYVVNVDTEENTLWVQFETGGCVDYALDEIDELKLAYCCTVHKYQGSEAKCIIMPLHTQHYIMLRRDLLYTAVTRTREMLILVGTGKALAIAVKNNKDQERFTGLWRYLAA